MVGEIENKIFLDTRYNLVNFSDTILGYKLRIWKLEKVGFLVKTYTREKTFAIYCIDAL